MLLGASVILARSRDLVRPSLFLRCVQVFSLFPKEYYTFLLTFFFFTPREQKKCSFSKTFLDPERLFVANATEGAKGRGVCSEGLWSPERGRGPLWGGRAEDVAARSERRSDP